MEYILVASAVLLIVLPSLAIFYDFGQSQTRSFESSQVVALGSRLALETQIVYNGGLGTRITLTEQFPRGIINISYINDSRGREYVIYYDPENSANPQIYGFPVTVPAHIDVDAIAWGQGQRMIRLDTLRNDTTGEFYVNVSIR